MEATFKTHQTSKSLCLSEEIQPSCSVSSFGPNHNPRHWLKVVDQSRSPPLAEGGRPLSARPPQDSPPARLSQTSQSRGNQQHDYAEERSIKSRRGGHTWTAWMSHTPRAEVINTMVAVNVGTTHFERAKDTLNFHPFNHPFQFFTHTVNQLR